MLATRLPELRKLTLSTERAVELAAPRWITGEEMQALERRYATFVFERFADGRLLVTPPAGWQSGTMNTELTRQVANWARERDRGVVMDSSGGVELPDGSLFAPDTTYIAQERWECADRSRTFAEAVPDAAFELLSTSDRVRTTVRKIRAYLRNGVRLVVLIDPKRRHVYVAHERDAQLRDLGDVPRVDCAPVMPGFVLDVAAILREP